MLAFELWQILVGDVFAVLWYRQHTQWHRLVELPPWVLVGLGLGALALWRLGEMDGGKDKDFLEPLIGTAGSLAHPPARVRRGGADAGGGGSGEANARLTNMQ